MEFQSQLFISLLENQFAGIILWDNKKILRYINDQAKRFLDDPDFKEGYCWYKIFEKILVENKLDSLEKINDGSQSRMLLEKGKLVPINNKSKTMEWAVGYGDFRFPTKKLANFQNASFSANF